MHVFQHRSIASLLREEGATFLQAAKEAPVAVPLHL